MSQEVYELDEGLERIKTKIQKLQENAIRPIIIGVAGGSGSGKTTKVAKKIGEAFPGSQILSLDDYIRGQDFMDSIGSDNWDEPRVYDLELLTQHLGDLKRGLPIRKPVYSFAKVKRLGYEFFKPASVIVPEGLFALYPGIVQELDLKIFVDIAVHGSLIRRILRDVKRTGQTEEDILAQYVKTVYPMYKQHIEPTRASADIVIINQYVPEIEAEGFESKEIQIKIALKEKIAREKLEVLGLKTLGRVLQEDTYYVAPDWEKRYYDELMRIRKEEGKYFLAYKGPLAVGSVRVKPKIEFEVKPSLKDALNILGYKEVLFIRKQREKFFGNGLEIVIDEFKNGRCFLEFRTADPNGESQILACLEKLGLDQNSITKKSYLEMMLEGGV